MASKSTERQDVDIASTLVLFERQDKSSRLVLDNRKLEFLSPDSESITNVYFHASSVRVYSRKMSLMDKNKKSKMMMKKNKERTKVPDLFSLVINSILHQKHVE